MYLHLGRVQKRAKKKNVLLRDASTYGEIIKKNKSTMMKIHDSGDLSTARRETHLRKDIQEEFGR